MRSVPLSFRCFKPLRIVIDVCLVPLQSADEMIECCRILGQGRDWEVPEVRILQDRNHLPQASSRRYRTFGVVTTAVNIGDQLDVVGEPGDVRSWRLA